MKKHYFVRVCQFSGKQHRNQRKTIGFYDTVSNSLIFIVKVFKNAVKIICPLLGLAIVSPKDFGDALHVMKQKYNEFVRRNFFPSKPSRRYVQSMMNVYENDIMELCLQPATLK